MDERHWWIATKIQETFRIGGMDNASFLESYLTSDETLEYINHFLMADGLQRMFFYSLGTEDILTTEGLFYSSEIADIRQALSSSTNPKVLFFLRNSTEREVNAPTVEKEIFCGEIKTSGLESVASMLSDLFLPVMRNKNKQSTYNEDQKSSFFTMLEKSAHILQDTTTNVVQKSKAKVS